MNRKIHVGCSPLTGTIFAGTVLKDGRTWGTGKQDVTIDALVAVAEHATKFGRPVEITGPDGKLEYRITVEAFLASNKAMIGASHLNKAADTIDTIDTLRAQLAEAQRELITTASERDGLQASRIAYANEFPLNADGEPDIGNVHANIRSLKAQLAEAQRNAATPTPDAFHKALRLAQRESLDRTGSGVVNWNQADAVMSDEARHLVECYIAAIDAARGEKNGA